MQPGYTANATKLIGALQDAIQLDVNGASEKEVASDCTYDYALSPKAFTTEVAFGIEHAVRAVDGIVLTNTM